MSEKGEKMKNIHNYSYSRKIIIVSLFIVMCFVTKSILIYISICFFST